jgi:CheY-like chemotaxis protein
MVGVRKTMARPAKSKASLVIASDCEADAALIKTLLEEEHDDVSISISDDATSVNVLQMCPNILILAFKQLRDSEKFYLGLYRQGVANQLRSHRTIVLCTKEEVNLAYELCRRDLFDDYVLFWPVSLDIRRLQMSLYRALRELSVTQNPQQTTDESNDGKPATVSMTSRAAQLMSTNGATSLPAAVRTEQMNVLVVDDDDAQRKLVSRFLHAEGYASQQVANGDEALQLLAMAQFDIVLLDLQMPGMSGLEVIRKWRDTPGMPSIPVIIVTGNADRDTVRGGLELGIADYLVKPFDRKTLIARIHRALTNVSSGQRTSQAAV